MENEIEEQALPQNWRDELHVTPRWCLTTSVLGEPTAVKIDAYHKGIGKEYMDSAGGEYREVCPLSAKLSAMLDEEILK